MGYKIMKSGKVEEEFIAGQTVADVNNSTEYKLYCEVVERLCHADGKVACNFGDVDFNHRFLGDSNDVFLMKEQGEISGFPDFALVRPDRLIMFDHFKLSAAPRNRKGDKYLTMLRSNAISPSVGNVVQINELLKMQKWEFSEDNRVAALIQEMKDKVSKRNSYEQAVDGYISTGRNAEFINEDLAKPKELWLLAEDVTPYPMFLFLDSRVVDCLEELENIDGMLYVRNPLFGEPLGDTDHFSLIRNDECGRRELRGTSACAGDSALARKIA